jgi:hypothetical protein
MLAFTAERGPGRSPNCCYSRPLRVREHGALARQQRNLPAEHLIALVGTRLPAATMRSALTALSGGRGRR